jgi:hypothetical protein
MNRQHEKERAWREWHADYSEEDVPSQINPGFDVGFDAAWDAMQTEIRGVLKDLDRLRELTEEQK